MIVCAHPDCTKEFTQAPKGRRQRFCKAACRCDDWQRRNPRPKALNKVYNRTRYVKHRDKLLAQRKLRNRCHCECGNPRLRKATKCDECAAMPAPAVFLGARGKARQEVVERG